MKNIIFVRDDGGISVVVPVENARRSGETETEFLVRVAARSVPAGVKTILLDPEALPDRSFRDAWALSGAAVTVDMPKARDHAHNTRRAQRETELAPLDKQINISIADSKKVAEIEAQRAIIRNRYATMQTAIDTANTADELLVVLK